MGKKIRILDLPGSYSLHARSPDESVLRDVLLGRRKDASPPRRDHCPGRNQSRKAPLSCHPDHGVAASMYSSNEHDGHGSGSPDLSTSPSLPKRLVGSVIPMSASRREGLVEFQACHVPSMPQKFRPVACLLKTTAGEP